MKNKDNFIKWLYLLLFGVVVYILMQIYTLFTKNKDTSVKVQNVLILRSTLTNLEAEHVANELLISMDRMGTDEQQLFRALENLTRYDFEKVYKSFGLKAYNGFKEIDVFAFDKEYVDLRYWLESELSDEFYSVIETHIGKTSAFPMSHTNDTTFRNSIGLS